MARTYTLRSYRYTQSLVEKKKHADGSFTPSSSLRARPFERGICNAVLDLVDTERHDAVKFPNFSRFHEFAMVRKIAGKIKVFREYFQ